MENLVNWVSLVNGRMVETEWRVNSLNIENTGVELSRSERGLERSACVF